MHTSEICPSPARCSQLTKIQKFQHDIPSLLTLSPWGKKPNNWAKSPLSRVFLTDRQAPKKERGRRLVVKLVCKRLTLVALSSRTDNRQRAMGCYLGGTAPVWQDSMSRVIQNAADQVTEPVNIADAYDLHGSLNTQWNSNLLLKDLH